MKKLFTSSLLSRPLFACLGSLLLAVEPASAVVFKAEVNMRMLWTPVGRPEQVTVVRWYDIETSTPDPVIPAESENAPTSVSLTHPEGFFPITELADDFFGWLDLTIEGLAPGQTVRVERFQVLERDGQPDELALRQSFLITDGALRPIGDSYNTNLPNDISSVFSDGVQISDDPTVQDGHIFAQINFYEPAASTIVGDYLIRVSSPTDNGGAPAYTPLEYPFSIVSADADAPQGLEGRVLADGQPVAGAIVVKLRQLSSNADLLSGTTTDATGSYRLPSEDVDEFDFLALKEGYVGDFGPGTAVELEDYAFLTRDFHLEVGTQTVSGTLRDAATGAPLPGVELFLLSVADDGEFVSQKISVTWTDAAGNFSTSVTPGKWGIIVRGETARDMGYVTSSERPLALADLSLGPVENLEVALMPATSLIEGKLTNIYDEELFGVKIVAVDQNTGVAVFGTTDGEGDYQIGVTAGRWSVSPFAFALTRLEQSGSSATIVDLPGDGQSVRHDIEVRPAIVQIYGDVYDFDENPVGRLRLLVLNKDLDIDEGSFTYTYETDGYYSALVGEGDWQLMPDPRDLLDRDEEFIFIGDIEVTVQPWMFGDGIKRDIQVFRVNEDTPRIQLTLMDTYTSQPISNAYLHAYAFSPTLGKTLHSFAETDEDGVASIPVSPTESLEWSIHFSEKSLQDAGKKAIPTFTVSPVGAITEVAATTMDFVEIPLVGSIAVSEFGPSAGVNYSSTAESGRIYHIEASDDLKTWRSMGRVRAVDEAVRLFDYSAAETDRRFYRTVPETLFNPE